MQNGSTRLPAGMGVRDQIRQSLYDTITIAATESPIADRSFFSNVQGKAKYLTNLRQNNLLESQVSYMVQGISVEAQNQVTANILALGLISEHSYLSFTIGEKIYWEGPMRFLNGRMYHSAAVSTGTGTAGDIEATYEQFGAPKSNGVIFRGAAEMNKIAPLQGFRVDWSCSGMTAAEIVSSTPVAASKLLFVCRLQGLQRRPIQ